QGTLPWSNLMRLLKDYDNADAELVIYATSLINKTLAGLNDQDSFYDESDLLEQQGMESVIQRYISKPGTDLDLLDQLQLYEAVLKFEDGEAEGIRLPENSLRKTQRHRQSTDTAERRKSRRHSTGTSPHVNKVIPSPKRITPTHGVLDEDSSSSTNSAEYANGVFNGEKARDGVGVTPGLRRRRERAERHKSFLKEQQEAAANGIFAALERREEIGQIVTAIPVTAKMGDSPPESLNLTGDTTIGLNQNKNSNNNIIHGNHTSNTASSQITANATNNMNPINVTTCNTPTNITGSTTTNNNCNLSNINNNNTNNSNSLLSPTRHLLGSNTISIINNNITNTNPVNNNNNTNIKLQSAPEFLTKKNLLMERNATVINGIMKNIQRGGDQLDNNHNNNNSHAYKKFENDANRLNSYYNQLSTPKNQNQQQLHQQQQQQPIVAPQLQHQNSIQSPTIQTAHNALAAVLSPKKTLNGFDFTQSTAEDATQHIRIQSATKQQELNKSKEIIVLDHKRSNAINIAMTKLPPPRAIKAAILKMDATVVTREGIDKLLNMLPTDEERGKIQEAQMANPELPLGSAEQFLLTLATISELGARLKLWAFRLDFDNSEKEIAEPLMDLKQGIEILRNNRTFKCILSTLLSVGIFLNGAPVKGFQIEYLSKVPEVKDTVHKHSLLHHLCHMVMESSPDTTDLYSEIGPITRASKADFSDLAHNLSQLETECKASWDRLKLIAKHDCPPQLKQKLVDFLADCAERIIILQIVHRRVINRYRKFLLWLGVPQHSVAESKPNEFCRILSEFALEYRTTRERVQQQLEKKANHRERNKTRGKLIIDMAKFKTKEDRADAELKELLGTPSSDTADGTLTWRRRRAENLRSPIARQSEENFTDGDDEILESLVKTATKAPGTRTTPRERKRTRHADRKSLRRTLKNGLTEEEKQHVAALIKTY
ncbi:PREDICTED: FH1/FH2 domain-containing protein 3-like, partial [Rhagoletis zephyria]|uniref:FH1/FH2 domain-containing protein 3-like n=1 Tax=Rhagoletis zephyria TaxID=28612 RepID=UPI0008112E8C